MECPIAPKKSNYNIYHVYKSGKVVLYGIPENLIITSDIATQLKVSYGDKKTSYACLEIIKKAGYVVEAEFKEAEYKSDLEEYRFKLSDYNKYIKEYSIKESGYNVTPLTEYLYDVARQEDDSDFIDTYVGVLQTAEKITGINFLKGWI